MRYIRYMFLIVVGFVLMIMALANRGAITLKVLPPEIGDVVGWNSEITLPMFVVLFGGVVIGLLIGFVWEYLREYKYRAASTRHRRECERLEKEVERLKEPEIGSADEVLAIIDKKAVAG